MHFIVSQRRWIYSEVIFKAVIVRYLVKLQLLICLDRCFHLYSNFQFLLHTSHLFISSFPSSHPPLFFLILCTALSPLSSQGLKAECWWWLSKALILTKSAHGRQLNQKCFYGSFPVSCITGQRPGPIQTRSVVHLMNLPRPNGCMEHGFNSYL